MEKFFEALFHGLSSGAIYSLVALGIVVVFRGSGHLNFAQGEMSTLSAYVASIVAAWTLPAVQWDVPMWAATIVAMGVGFLIGAAAEVLIVRPLGKRSPLAVFVALIAVFLGINAFNTGKWGAPPNEIVTSLFPNEPNDFVEIFGAAWPYSDIGTLVVTLIVTALLFLLFAKTKIGLAMRAVASNTDSAKLVGVPTGWILAGSWGLAGALAALAGTMYAGAQGNPGQVTPILMFTVFVYASAAATLGGLDSPIGAVVAGLSIGVIENQAASWAPGWIGNEMKLSVALLCIFVVLLVRPAGLFGTIKVERV